MRSQSLWSLFHQQAELSRWLFPPLLPAWTREQYHSRDQHHLPSDLQKRAFLLLFVLQGEGLRWDGRAAA